MAEQQSFKGIYLIGQGKQSGLLLLREDGLNWKNRENGKNKTIPASEVQEAKWLQVGSFGQLRVYLRGGAALRLDGFIPKDRAAIAGFLKDRAGVELKDTEASCSGRNYGDLSLTTQSLALTLDGKTAFDVALSEISQCANPGKGNMELELQFHEDDTGHPDDENVVELRLAVPEGVEIEGVAADGGLSAAEALQKAITDRAGIGAVAGDLIVEFEASLLVPRGTYNVEMYPQFMRLIGRTYDYKIGYKSVAGLFLLENDPEGEVGKEPFVIALRTPIRQGKQAHHHLVMHLDKKQTMLNLVPSEEDLRERYGGKLQPTMRKAGHKLVATLFKVLANRGVTMPPKAFATSKKTKAVPCAFKSSQGALYPLNKALFYVHKPPLFLRYDDIDFVEFLRYDEKDAAAGGSSTFDLSVRSKPISGDAGQTVVFSSIPRDEYSCLFYQLHGHSVRIKNMVKPGSSGKKRVNYAELEGGGPDVVDSEDEDEDFVAPAQSDGEGGGDDDAAEDSDASGGGADASGSDDEQPKKRRKRAGGSGASGGMEEEEEEDDEGGAEGEEGEEEEDEGGDGEGGKSGAAGEEDEEDMLAGMLSD